MPYLTTSGVLDDFWTLLQETYRETFCFFNLGDSNAYESRKRRMK